MCSPQGKVVEDFEIEHSACRNQDWQQSHCGCHPPRKCVAHLRILSFLSFILWLSR